MLRVSLSALLIFTNQFANMMRSQLPLLKVLENLADETPQKRLREVLDEVCNEVRRGVDLSEALAFYPGVFNSIYVNVVRAGMMSGRLAESLTQLSEYLTKVEETGRKFRTVLSYPLFMLVAFIAVLNAMVFFILPRFEKMFASFNRELPVPTQMLIDLGAFWRGYWYVIAIAVASAVVAFFTYVASEEGRYQWDRVKLDFPALGKLWRLAALSRFLRTFAVQAHNGVEILDALRLSASASGNTYIEESIYAIANDIEKGRGVAEAFRAYDVFSGIVLQMIASGEEAGTLDELLMSAARYFDSLLDEQVQSWTALVNPILTVVIGLAIAGMMIATFLPVFDLGGAVGGGR